MAQQCQCGCTIKAPTTAALSKQKIRRKTTTNSLKRQKTFKTLLSDSQKSFSKTKSKTLGHLPQPRVGVEPRPPRQEEASGHAITVGSEKALGDLSSPSLTPCEVRGNHLESLDCHRSLAISNKSHPLCGTWGQKWLSGQSELFRYPVIEKLPPPHCQ